MQLGQTVTVELPFIITDNMIFLAAFPDKYCVDDKVRCLDQDEDNPGGDQPVAAARTGRK